MSTPKPTKKQPMKPKKVVRHHPFERALTWAKNRLVKAEADRKKHYDAVVALDQEIPKLREIIRVHGGQADDSVLNTSRAKKEMWRNAIDAEVNQHLQTATQKTRDVELLPDIPMPHAPVDPEADPIEAAEQALKTFMKK